MLLSCHTRVLEWICTLQLPECQRTLCSKQRDCQKLTTKWLWAGILLLPFNSNRIPVHNHLVHKQVLNYLAKLIKQLSCVMSTYLYGVLDYMLSSCHVRASKWNNIISWHVINESSIIFAKSLPFSQMFIARFQV